MSDHDVDRAGNPPEVNPDKIEIYQLKERIAELEAELEVSTKKRKQEEYEESLWEKIREKERRILELEAERDAAFNAGMERAAEIVENTRSATGHERNLTQVELCAEAIRKEIEK